MHRQLMVLNLDVISLAPQLSYVLAIDVDLLPEYEDTFTHFSSISFPCPTLASNIDSHNC